MFKKITTFLLIPLALALGGFGCKGLSQEQAAALKPVKLEYWTVYNNVEELQKMAAEYKALRPYVTVNIRQVQYEEFDRLFTNALADDVAPDIVSMHVHWLRKNLNRLSPAPASVNMARVIKKSQYSDEIEVLIDTIPMPSVKTIKDAYVKTVYEDVVVNGNLYGFPLALDSLAVFYNRNLLDLAGVPEAPKTWDEFVLAVKKTTKFNASGDIVQSGTALGTGKNIDASFDIISMFMSQSGVTMSQGSAVTFASGVAEAQNRNHPTFKALDFYTDFARPTREVYSWNEKKDPALDEFVRGKVAFYFGYSYNYPTIKARAPQMNMQILPMFQLNPDAPSNIANYWVESVVGKSKNKNEAWDFVRFISSPDNVKKYTDAVFRPSPLRSQIVEQQKDENMEPFATQALFATNWYRGTDVVVAKDAFSQLITELLKPAGELDMLKRDKQLIINAAARVQQTM